MRTVSLRVQTKGDTEETHEVLVFERGDHVPMYYDGRPVRLNLGSPMVALVTAGGAGMAYGAPQVHEALDLLAEHYEWEFWEVVHGPSDQ